MEAYNNNSSVHRSKRSNANLSNLRPSPLATAGPQDGGNVDVDEAVRLSEADIAYQHNHGSYLGSSSRSASSTPGILGRSASSGSSSSRRPHRHLGAGLSRKLSIYDAAAVQPVYAPVMVTEHGVPQSALRPDYAGLDLAPKAQSEAALLQAKRRALAPPHHHHHHHQPRLHIQPPPPPTPQNSQLRHHTRSHTSSGLSPAITTRQPPFPPTSDDDWLTRAGLATSSLLRESKGQSWLASRHSSTSLATPLSSSDLYAYAANDSDDEYGSATDEQRSHQHLQFADDELSPETPRAASRWGSRFGSRLPSARNSRRGSRVSLLRTPVLGSSSAAIGIDDYFSGRPDFAVGQGAETPGVMGVEPDFVDVHEGFDSDGEEGEEQDPEEEVGRLARERASGIVGGLVDRLVGWTLFNLDEDREATDGEEGEVTSVPQLRRTTVVAAVDDDAAAVGVGAGTGADGADDAAAAAAPPREEHEGAGGGWQDAAWLLSVASKVLL